MIASKVGRGSSDTARNLRYYIILILWCGFGTFVLLWLLYTSLKTNQELFADVWSLPETLHWANYRAAWVTAHMGRYFSNSVIVACASVFSVLVISAPAAYVLTRMEFFGREFFRYLFIAGLGIPIQLLLVPWFVLLRRIQGINTLWGLSLVYVAESIPFTVFLLSGFMRTLPTELEEAAALDGCSEFGIFYRVMLPLAQPGLIATALFNFAGTWSEYLMALILIPEDKKRTLPLGIYNLRNSMQFRADWTGLFAGVVIVIVPILVVFAFFSDVANLEVITPRWVGFRIRTPLPVEMKRDTLLEYRLLLAGVPVSWRTRIVRWEPPGWWGSLAFSARCWRRGWRAAMCRAPCCGCRSGP